MPPSAGLTEPGLSVGISTLTAGTLRAQFASRTTPPVFATVEVGYSFTGPTACLAYGQAVLVD